MNLIAYALATLLKEQDEVMVDNHVAITISNKDTDGYVIVDAVQLLPQNGM